MNILSASKITKSSREDFLFKEITFGLAQGEKVALIGRNGCGKSTLLKIIAQKIEADSGDISINNEVAISYLSQTPEYAPSDRIIDYVFQTNNKQSTLIRDYENACMAMAKQPDNEEVLKHFASVSEQMDLVQAWNYEQEIRSILAVLDINDLSLSMSELSGGMLKKVQLAHILIEDSELLLLDEPTNHLDIETIAWLEEFLIHTKKTILMVTHDRRFLDTICSAIYEIDNKALMQFKGNFSYYLEKKEQEELVAQRTESSIRSHIRNELEWIRRAPQARGTKSKARKDAFYALANREKRDKSLEFEFDSRGRRLGGVILEADSVNKKYEEQIIIKDFSYSFKKGERLGLFGRNGSGKSTLLNLLAGVISPDKGEITKGENTVIGYYRQEMSFENLNLTVLEYIKETAEMLPLADGKVLTASKLLENFGFSGKDQRMSLTKLSGGERKRLYLVKTLLLNPNFLILDEPTNDFDLYTMMALEEYLLSFAGCIVLVSHDRYFMDKIISHMLVIEEGEVIGFSGNSSECIAYKKELEEENKKENVAVEKKIKKKEAVVKKKRTYKEQQEFELLEDVIIDLEKQKTNYEKLMSSGETDYEKLKEWGILFDEVAVELEEKYARWEYLGELEE